MKQRLPFLIAILLFCQQNSFAQSSQDKIKFAIKAGINVNTYGMNSDRKKEMKEEGFKIKPSFSFHIGGFADYSLKESISLQAGLTLSGKGIKESWSNEDAYSGVIYDGTFKESLLYLEVPINIVYKWSKFQIGAGPYLGYALSGKWKESFISDDDGDIESGSESGKVKFGGEYAYTKRGDIGVNLLAGYRLTNNITLGAGYGMGLSNIHKNDDLENAQYWSQKHRVFSISFIYSL